MFHDSKFFVNVWRTTYTVKFKVWTQAPVKFVFEAHEETTYVSPKVVLGFVAEWKEVW